MIERSPRAPVLRRIALWAIALQRLLIQFEPDILHLEQPLILLDEGVLGLGQNVDQHRLVEIVEGRHDRQPADEFGNQPEFQQILGFEILQDFSGFALLGPPHLGAEADRGALPALRDDFFEPGKRAAAHEENVGRVDLEKFLLRVLAAALRRDRGDGPLHDLQKRLLDAFARHVARDRRVVGFAGDLVDLVDIDDPALRALDVIVGGLQQLQNDVLDVLADIAGLGQASSRPPS